MTSNRLKSPPVGAGWPVAMTRRRLGATGVDVGAVAVGAGAFKTIAQIAAAHMISTATAASATRLPAPLSRSPANGAGMLDQFFRRPALMVETSWRIILT